MTPEQAVQMLETNKKILETNNKVLATNTKILRELEEVKNVTRELTEARILKRTQDAARKRKQRANDREAALKGKLDTPRGIWKRDGRLLENGTYKRWACIGIRLGLQGRTASFLRYLMWDWNNNVFKVKPITKTNGGLHLYKGKGTCRLATTVGNMFGNDRSFNAITAGEATIFEWGCFHMCAVMTEMAKMPRWADLPRDFVHCIQFICGGYAEMTPVGGLKLRGYTWDPADGPELFPKVAEFRSLFTRCMRALKQGLISRADQFKDYCTENGLDDLITHGLEDYEVLCKLDEDIKKAAEREEMNQRFLKKLKAQQHSQKKNVQNEQQNRAKQAVEIVHGLMSMAQEESQIQHAIEASLVEDRPLGGNDDEKTATV